MEYTHENDNRSLINVNAGNSLWQYRIFQLRVCEIAVIFYSNYFCRYFYIFFPGTNKIKYYFENSNQIFWVAAISAGQSLEGEHKIFYFRPIIAKGIAIIRDK